MATFRVAEAEWVDLLAEVMRKHHPDLVEAGVRVGLLFAHAPRDETTGEPKGPALKRGGAAVLLGKMGGVGVQVAHRHVGQWLTRQG